MSLAARIERMSMGEPNSGCWLWLGTVRNSGYGRLDVAGKTVNAHRVSWELHNGPIPKGEGYHGICVLHKCDTRTCVNPLHLFLGTQQDNMRDMARKGRHGFSKRTHCRSGHEYTPENTGRSGHDGSRWCRTCQSIQKIAKYHADHPGAGERLYRRKRS